MENISTKDTEEKTNEKKTPWAATSDRFVCFLDIMGFKDMVMRNTHNEIYELLGSLSTFRDFIETENMQGSLKTVSFSDSIVIFTKDNSIECFELFTSSISWLFAKAMDTCIPMKGAISLGKMSVNTSRQIFFGQPLIDAYLLEEDVGFYGIVVHNTVEKYINENKSNKFIKKAYCDCVTPFKFGKAKHLVLDWVQSVEDTGGMKLKDYAKNLMKKQRERTSGNPRKYIDNTIEIIDQNTYYR